MKTALAPQRMAQLLALAFAIPGVLGFLPNPLIGPDSLFAANAAHNLVHLVTAALFVAVSIRSAHASRQFMRAFGVVYLLVGVLGFVVLNGRAEGMLLGLIHINQLDNVLHIGLGLVISLAGFLPPRSTPVESA